jgi:acid phosphatase type 7
MRSHPHLRCPGVLAVLLAAFITHDLCALSVIRAPYLQLGTSNSIVIRWRTDQPVVGRVQFGQAADALTNEVLVQAAVSNHTVTLSNLLSDTKYFYAVGTPSTNLAAGPSFYFVTAPAHSKPARIWVTGDNGSTFNQPPEYWNLGLLVNEQAGVRDAYYAYSAGRHTDVWLLLGDNAYNLGTDGDYQTNFFNLYSDFTPHAVLWPALGNHDVDTAPGDARSYLEIFTLPTQAEAGGLASGTEKYYSFNYGNIHFVCLDSEMSGVNPGGPMLTWLQNDLTADHSDWRIVYWHHPPYSKGSHDSDSVTRMIQMRQNVSPILEAAGVDLVLCGHSHVYERSFLIDSHYGQSWQWTPTMALDSGSGRPDDSGPYLKSSLAPMAHGGTVYVVAGSAGWAWRAVGLNHPAMFMGASEVGSLVLDVSSNRLDAKFLRETGALDDHFTILKGIGPDPLTIKTIRVAGGNVVLQFRTLAGVQYQLERATRLDPSDWQPASSIITATGVTTKLTNAAPGGTRFYRVVQVSD